MVAIAHPSRRSAPARMSGDRPARLRLVVDNAPRCEAERSQSAAFRSVVSSPGRFAGLVLAAVLVFGGVFGLRAIQGAPSAAEADGPGPPVVAPSPAGATTVVAQPGDTLWSIAEGLAPGRDPRPVVQALIEVNGGASLQAGERIIVPEHLQG